MGCECDEISLLVQESVGEELVIFAKLYLL